MEGIENGAQLRNHVQDKAVHVRKYKHLEARTQLAMCDMHATGGNQVDSMQLLFFIAWGAVGAMQY